jgi:phosphoribosylformylglycinamidine synthase
MREACVAFETPVTGGNVSFYNESPTAAVFPTPTIGMLGIIEKESHVTSANFKKAGDSIFLLGTNRGDISGSEFLVQEYGLTVGDAPYFDLPAEVKLQECALELIWSGCVRSAHDVSDGGLIVALIESAIIGGTFFGCDLTIECNSLPLYKVLFGEEQSRIVITVDDADAKKIMALCDVHHVPVSKIGTVRTEPTMTINNEFTVDMRKVGDLFHNALHRAIYNSR